MVAVQINGHPARALIDSGSLADFMSTTLAEKLDVPCYNLPFLCLHHPVSSHLIALFHLVTPSPRHPITSPPHHLFTHITTTPHHLVISSYSITQTPYHPITLSLYHSITLHQDTTSLSTKAPHHSPPCHPIALSLYCLILVSSHPHPHFNLDFFHLCIPLSIPFLGHCTCPL